MPRASGKIVSTDRELRCAKSNGERTDFRIRGAQHPLLRETSTGTKSWSLVYKTKATGRWRKLVLGSYPEIGLAEAKGRAIEMAADIRRGKDPHPGRRDPQATGSFAELAESYLREHELRNSRTGKRSASTREAQRQLEADVLPSLGGLRADAVTRQQVGIVVEAVAEHGAYVAADTTSVWSEPSSTGGVPRAVSTATRRSGSRSAR